MPRFILLAFASLCLELFCSGSLSAQSILVQPYVQPGASGTLTGTDDKRLMWMTDQIAGEFKVEFAAQGSPPRTVQAKRVSLDFAPAKPKADAKTDVKTDTKDDEKSKSIPERSQHYFKYTAQLDGLPFDSVITYRVKLGDAIVREGAFPTRATATKPVRFIMVGDLADGKGDQNAIAYQISLVKPQFLVALGDIVYPSGRVNQYMDHFWPTYNQPSAAGAATGVPLMASVPFYAVMGNHDAASAKLENWPDGLGAYHFFHAPENGPGEGPWSTQIGSGAPAKAFRASVGSSYPALSQYSFDCGPAHFMILDNSGASTQDSPKLREWIERDLRGSKARWKFVCFHAPMFHSSREHYTEQRTRLFSPLFEACGVDVVFAGHVHNYQRSKPMRFSNPVSNRILGGLVNGDYKLDENFDGITRTRPDGIIHIVEGGGGAKLYRGELEKNKEFFAKQPAGNWAPYTTKFIADQHSFTVVDLTPQRLELRALNSSGGELDRIVIDKP